MRPFSYVPVALFTACWLTLAGADRPSHAAPLEAEAVAGAPLGIGRIVVPLAGAADVAIETGAFQLVEARGRTLYPAFTTDRVLTAIRGLLIPDQPAGPRQLTVLFLFTGNEPLDLTVHAQGPHQVRLVPWSQPRLHERLLRRWWRTYVGSAERQEREGDYPPLVETYLTTMLGSRLGLDPPLLSRPPEAASSVPREALELLAGAEKLRLAVMRQTIQGRGAWAEPADLPLPADIPWAPLPLPEDDPQVAVEPMAMHVPEEWLYIRFGRFENYLWLTHLLEDYGGDISRMVRLRGHDAGLNARFQAQLGIKESALAELLGGQVTSDVALVGRDMFLREGAAMGILFEARGPLLGNDLTSQRAAAVKRLEAQGAREEKLTIGGRQVSLASTPDNRLRSFYAVDGRYHLVTTSRAMVEQFLEPGQGRGVLGNSREFRHARRMMPLERDDTVFVYFSSAFFAGLFHPQYQVELRRRLQAVVDLELIGLARLAAAAEGRPAQTVAQLASAGLLPRGFGQRSDGSRPVLDTDQLRDHPRGARGTFTPIADMPVTEVTRSEASQFARLVDFQQRQWTRMDPLVVGLRRFALNQEGLERVTIDAWMLPFDRSKFGTISSMLGPPSYLRVALAPDDVVSIQAVLQGGRIFPGVQPQLLFLGLKDLPPPMELARGPILRALQILTTAPAYLGAWPKPGLLDRLPLIGRALPDELGYTRYPLGLWRRESADGFAVVSFQRPILEAATPHIRLEQADNAAQLRVHVGDLSSSRIGDWVEGLNYQRAYQASLGNARLLHALSQQLRVPPADALTTAERLLDVKLICPLGGQYQLVGGAGQSAQWVSTRWPGQADGSAERVAEYRAPLLTWFRGLEADAVTVEDRLTLRAQLDMQRAPRDKPAALPLFEFFKRKPSEPDPNKTRDGQPLPEALPAPAQLPPPEEVPAQRPVPENNDSSAGL